MSVSFWGVKEDGNSIEGERTPETACLCAQMDPTWDMYLEKSDRESLARSAHPECPHCQGTGVEPGYDTQAEINYSSMNARIVLSLLGLCAPPSRIPLKDMTPSFGLDSGQNDLTGDQTVPEMRQRIMVARATFDTQVSALTSEEECVYGAPRTNEEGAVELRPLRAWSRGLDEEDIREKFYALVDFVELIASEGATTVHWG